VTVRLLIEISYLNRDSFILIVVDINRGYSGVFINYESYYMSVSYHLLKRIL
jgi:hypothetical protein